MQLNSWPCCEVLGWNLTAIFLYLYFYLYLKGIFTHLILNSNKLMDVQVTKSSLKRERLKTSWEDGHRLEDYEWMIILPAGEVCCSKAWISTSIAQNMSCVELCMSDMWSVLWYISTTNLWMWRRYQLYCSSASSRHHTLQQNKIITKDFELSFDPASKHLSCSIN